MTTTRTPTEQPQLARWRIRAFVVGTALMLAAAAGYSLYAVHRHTTQNSSTKPGSPPLAFASAVPLSGPPKLVYVSTQLGAGYDHLAEVGQADPAGSPTLASLTCERSYAAAGTLVCLRSEGTLVATQYAEVYRDTGTLKLVDKVPLAGIPSRARVSADGEMAAWTVFVGGDSYNGPNFSTRASILNLRTGAVIPSLETFTPYINGAAYRAVDINYWGVTFTADDDHFYATMSSGGRIWLMYGDLAAKTLHSVVPDVECPSLSPDGTRIVFKKRVSSSYFAPWRLYVLDLKTLKETPLAETRSIDDQAAWLDNGTVMYQVAQAQGGYDIWDVPADGTGAPKLLVHDGFSPAAIGQ